MKLATCWVGGFFRPDVAATVTGTDENERVLAVTPVGYAKESQSIEEKLMTGFGGTHQRKRLSSLVTGLQETQWPGWVRAALGAARIAPFAMNRQPWSFHIEGRIEFTYAPPQNKISAAFGSSDGSLDRAYVYSLGDRNWSTMNLRTRSTVSTTLSFLKSREKRS